MQTSTRRLFTTVRTEGALLPADLLGRVVEGDAALKGLTPEDYHLLPGERINEATNRAWNRAVGAWAAFQAARARWSPNEPGTSDTRERWLLPLLQELGYGRLTVARAIEARGKTYPVSHIWGHVPIHLVGAGIDLDRRTAGVAGAARTSPHGLVQELLTNADEYLWGFVSNGLRLRILRDSVRLSRPAYVEFDLEALMEGEVYADFVLLWLLCHESRVEAERPEECWLEQWVRVAREQGTRVREDLRGGVQRAIEALGRGFLAHPANGALRERLRTGDLDAQAYYHELLRLVYRLLFLFVAEDRDALLDPNAAPEAKQRYADYYSTRRLRHLAGRQRGSRHGDLYVMLRQVLTALGDDHGLPGLALPSLGSMLFASGAASATPSLDTCTLANQDLLEAIRALAFVVDRSVRRPVDFRNLGTEELGSVYEALLELRPTLAVDSGQFALETVRGNERKTTGSYYTPESLAAELVKSAVEPVLEAAVARGGDAERAILSLKICDPAAGSGHFLLTAARMLAKRLAQARTGDAEPAPAAVRTALRDVISHCVYAVDVNPMAVELCKVSLWMEAVEPGKPLNFLDHHITCGNSLIGATRELLGQGIPDEAFDPVTGDDKAVAREIKRRNRREREGQLKLPFPAEAPRLGNLAEDYRRLTAMPEDTPEQIHAKQREYERLIGQLGYDNSGRLYADAWCAAFFWPLDDGHEGDAPTEGELRKLEQSPWSASIFLKQEVRRIAGEQRFFHWHLEFPDVFDGSAGEGFDCVLGNPPWEQVELKEEEFFAVRAPDVLAGGTGAERKRRIEALAQTDPALYQAFVEARLEYDRERKFLQNSGRFPLTGRGRTNLYSVFAENDRALISPAGRAGIIVPTGIATDDTNKMFFGDVVSNRALASLYDFENREGIFPEVHRSYKFCTLTLTGDQRGPERADLMCFALRAEDLLDTERHFTLTPGDFALINPNTRTLPIFRSRRDAELTLRMYRAAPVLVDESGPEPVSPWGVTFRQGLFNMTSDSHLFRTRAELEEQGYALGSDGVFRGRGQDDYVPLYEAKLFHQFDHRFATFAGGPGEDKARDTTEAEHRDPCYVPLPRYWVPRAEVERRLNHWTKGWVLLYRRIARSTDERTFIATITPRVGAGDPAPVWLPPERFAHLVPALSANLSSIAFDFVARQKCGGIHLDFYLVKQLPVLPPATYDRRINGERLAEWVTRRALELTYTSDDMAPLARDLGYDGPPFAWDEARRAELRGELDGLYAHLYGLSRDDFAYLLTTFPVLEKNERRKYGEYRTARLALAAYDALAPAMVEVGSSVR
jgi:hypothetical protein